MQFKKWIFYREFETKVYLNQLERLRDNFKGLNSALTLEKTKMPLGAKLTQNDFKCNF